VLPGGRFSGQKYKGAKQKKFGRTNLMAEFWQKWPKKFFCQSLIAEMRKMTQDIKKFHNIFSKHANSLTGSIHFSNWSNFFRNWLDFFYFLAGKIGQ